MFLLSLNIRDELNLRVLGRDEPANPDVLSMELNCHLSSQGEKKKVDLRDPDMHFPECSILKLMLYTFTTQPNLVFIHFFFIKTTFTGYCWAKSKSKNMQSTKPIVNIFRTVFMMLQTSFKLLLVPFQIDGRRFSCFSGCSSTFLYAPFHNFYSQLPFLWLDHSVSVCICDLTKARCTFWVVLTQVCNWKCSRRRRRRPSAIIVHQPTLPCPALVFMCTTRDVEFFIVFLGKPENSW